MLQTGRDDPLTQSHCKTKTNESKNHKIKPCKAVH